MVWLQQLTSDLLNRSIKKLSFSKITNPQYVWLKNQQIHGQTKYIDIKYHFIWEIVENGQIKLAYCPSGDMVADILTKGLPAQQFKELCGMAGKPLSVGSSACKKLHKDCLCQFFPRPFHNYWAL